ncbi:MAG: hypothetical protein SGJ02_08835 [bacterium]|nr:hypothetical protein [bacterium]
MLILFCLIILLIPNLAQAYLDPGTGSVILQSLIAVALGAAFTIKTYWRRLRVFFASKAQGKSDDVTDQN